MYSDTTVCDKVCQWLATGRYIPPGTPVSSPNKTDRHDITEILLKVVLSAISLNLICVIVIICSLAFKGQKVSYLNLPGQSLYGGFTNII